MALLDVRTVTHRYGGATALHNVSLQVDAGGITGLIGPNGAGKSTLFEVIAGVVTPHQGSVLLAGEDLSGHAPAQRARRGIARTFQRVESFGSLTVRESVELAAHASRRGDTRIDAEGIVELVGLGALGEVRTDRLPTGHARLAELARALAARPRVLLLDEPASGLDDAETERLCLVLERVRSDDRAILLVEHDIGVVMRLCGLVHVLDHGCLIASGSPIEVRHDPAVQASYLGPVEPRGRARSTPPLVKEPSMTATRAAERIARFDADLAGVAVAAPIAKARRLARFGAGVMVLGPCLALIAYFISHRTTDAFVQHDALVLAGAAVCVTLAGAAAFVRYGLEAALAAGSASRPSAAPASASTSPPSEP